MFSFIFQKNPIALLLLALLNLRINDKNMTRKWEKKKRKDRNSLLKHEKGATNSRFAVLGPHRVKGHVTGRVKKLLVQVCTHHCATLWMWKQPCRLSQHRQFVESNGKLHEVATLPEHFPGVSPYIGENEKGGWHSAGQMCVDAKGVKCILHKRLNMTDTTKQ